MHRPPRHRLLAAFVVSATLCAPAVAFAQLHLSLWHPISTNSDPHAHANLALSVFQSRIGQLHGIGIHPFVSQVSGDAAGLSFVGAYSQVGGDMKGFQGTWGIAAVGGDVKGFQSAFIGNFVDGGVTGLQSAFVVNRVRGDTRGVQFAGFINTNSGATRGIQVSSVANVSEGPVHGFQVAAGINLATQSMQGLQIGLGNLAGDADGSQIGFYNVSSTASGMQIGAINYAGTNTGIPFGVINLSPNSGRTEAVAYASTFSAANLGIRTTVNRWQSTFAAGGIDLEGDVSTSAFLSWFYGYRFPLGDKAGLAVDAGFTHVMPQVSDDPTENDRLHYAISFRALPEVRLSDAVSLFGGPGVTRIYNAYAGNSGHSDEFLGTLGLAVKL